jgi:hypothetical protein
MRTLVSGLNQKMLPTESQDPRPHIIPEYNLSTQTTDTTREDMLSSSLYLRTPTSNQERLLHSIEECGTSCCKINTVNHSLDAQELTSTTSTDQQKNQTTTTEGHNIVDSHQNLSKKRDLLTYRSETHRYLQSGYQTLPHHTAQERQNQIQQIYQSSRHRQYNAVALLLLKQNNHKHRWRQPAPWQLLSPLNPYHLVELSTLYLQQLAEEQPALVGLLLKSESNWDSSPHYVAEEEEETHPVAVAAVAEAAEEAEEHRLLRSLRPPLRQLFPKQPTSELWEPLQEYLKEIEPRQRTSSMNSDTTTVSTEESLGSIPLRGKSLWP